MGIFNERLKQLKEEKDIMLKDLAFDLETTSPKLSAYINGNTEPSYEFLVKIARYFNVTTDYLTGNDDSNENIQQNFATLMLTYNNLKSENIRLNNALQEIYKLSETLVKHK